MFWSETNIGLIRLVNILNPRPFETKRPLETGNTKSIDCLEIRTFFRRMNRQTKR